MRRYLAVVIAAGLMASAAPAFAEWSITNKDNSSYELTKQCGSSSEGWSIAGGVTKRLSIPAGSTSCTLTLKNNGSSCSVKDGEGCLISGGRLGKQ